MVEQNILFIVEGENKEKAFFEKISGEFGLNSAIYAYKTNIYALYSEMKSYDFNADIISILKTKARKEELTILNKKFAYIYLIFDYEIQHNTSHGDFEFNKVQINADKIKEMADYFVNETDPTIGKLYINFPMFESYKDIDDFNDESFANRICLFKDIQKYKEKVGCRKIANTRIDKMKSDEFKALSLLNLKKLNFLMKNVFEKPNINSYRNFKMRDLVQKENEFVFSEKHFVSVINTSCLFIVDYFGLINSFYDSL